MNATNAQFARSLVTTESWDLPIPNVAVTPDLAYLLTLTGVMSAPIVNVTISDLVRALDRCRPYMLSVQGPGLATYAAAMNGYLRRLLSWDLATGTKMDLNRPFGDGRDDSTFGAIGYGVVDEPGESQAIAVGEPAWEPGNLAGAVRFTTRRATRLPRCRSRISTITTTGLFARNGQLRTFPRQTTRPAMQADINDMYCRQLYARLHLRAALHADRSVGRRYDRANSQYLEPLPTGDTTPPWSTWYPYDVYRRLAQWAVNIVDYRDADSIMTAFEFDALPFIDSSATADGNPWDVRRQPRHERAGREVTHERIDASTARRGVGVAERPELLITETFAVHDRRTQDSGTGHQRSQARSHRRRT